MVRSGRASRFLPDVLRETRRIRNLPEGDVLAGPGDRQASEAVSPGRRDGRERRWAAVAFSRRQVPGVIRQYARRRWMLAEAREVERTAGARDADDNRDTRVPDGEQVRVPAIWLTELYTPTTLGGLTERLPSVMAKTRDQHPERGDIVEWLQDARRRGGGAWRMLPNVTSADAGIRTSDWIVDNLPEQVASVTWGIYALTSTVTAVTALFRLKEDHPAGLQRIVDQDVSTRATITPQGGYTVSDVRWQKQQAADKWREDLRAGASAWLADRLPGSFHRLRPGQLPAIELLTTERQLPWDEREARPQPRRGWTQLLDLESYDGYWQCTAIPWLRLRERRSRGWGSSPRHMLTLGALRQGLLSLSTSARTATQQPDFALEEAIYLTNFYVVPLANRLALTALLAEFDEQLAATRDLTEQATGSRSPRALDQVRQQLVTSGLESQIVANDIASFARDEQSWKYEFLDFSQVLPEVPAMNPDRGRAVPPAREPRRRWRITLRQRTRTGKEKSGQRRHQDAQEQAPASGPTSLAESLRQGQIERGTVVAESEAKVRDLINTSAQLTAAAENIRLQRRVWWLTAFSAIVAVIAAAAAVAALRAPSSSPIPVPAPRPSISHPASTFPTP